MMKGKNPFVNTSMQFVFLFIIDLNVFEIIHDVLCLWLLSTIILTPSPRIDSSVNCVGIYVVHVCIFANCQIVDVSPLIWHSSKILSKNRWNRVKSIPRTHIYTVAQMHGWYRNFIKSGGVKIVGSLCKISFI
jgi:hypothetical protein